MAVYNLRSKRRAGLERVPVIEITSMPTPVAGIHVSCGLSAGLKGVDGRDDKPGLTPPARSLTALAVRSVAMLPAAPVVFYIMRGFAGLAMR